MSAQSFGRCGSFSAEEVNLLSEVFESTMDALHLVRRDDVVAGVVAARIIELAESGERDPERLRSTTLESLGLGPVRLPIAS